MDSPETRCENRNGVFVCGARTGSSVTLVCNAMGNPTPTVTVSPSTAPTTDNNIVFQAVTVNNTGNYSCTASSPGFNDVVRRFELTVAGGLCINEGLLLFLSSDNVVSCPDPTPKKGEGVW